MIEDVVLWLNEKFMGYPRWMWISAGLTVASLIYIAVEETRMRELELIALLR